LCLSAFAFLLLYESPTSAHEPVTTKVRFNKEVIRTLQRSCLGCHHAGGIAFSLATYDEARPWAKAIKEEVLRKRMPPWNAVKGYGEFRNSPVLTQRDIDLLVNWVEGGAPAGDEKDLPAGAIYSADWPLSPPDLILKPKVATKIASDADEYRSFTLETRLTADRWLRAVDLKPGNGAIVHCATVKVEGASDNTTSSILATWMPGQRPVSLNAPAAQLLPAGSHLNLRIHYRGSGDESSDLSEVGLYFATTESPKRLQELAVSDPSAIIPAGSARHRVKASTTVQADLEALAVRPSVYPLLISMQATAYRPDGSQEILIWTRGFQFDWQPAYQFKRPIVLPKGTRVEIVAYFDNSDENRNNPNDPPKQLRWSDLTAEPMFTLMAVKSDSSE
jgi:hypothetical protein